MFTFKSLLRSLAGRLGVIAILSISSASIFAAEKLAPVPHSMRDKQGPEISAQDSDIQKSNWLLGVILKLGNMRDKAIADIQKYEGEIQKCDTTISKSENIVRLAQQKGNVQAEIIAREASLKAQEAKLKNKEKKNSAELNKKRVDAALDHMRKDGAEPEAMLEQVEFENMNDRWVQNQKHLIEQRLKEPNPYASEIYRSLKTKVPPVLPDRKYDKLQPGDVLLFSPDDTKTFWINFGDKLSSASKSPAYHTVLYLKEVNGKKLFLDNRPGRGSHVISE